MRRCFEQQWHAAPGSTPARASSRHGMVGLLVADDGVELDDGLLLLGAEGPALDVRPEVVGPPQPAALAAPVQPCTRASAGR